MLYLLDANVLITADKQYYAIDRVPEFWDWLIYMAKAGSIRIPEEVYEEFDGGKDQLATWANQDEVRDSLLFGEAADVSKVRQVIKNGYAPDLSDEEIETLGRDPFLVAYALIDPANRTIVTTEVSKPNRKRANRHLPDVCNQFGLNCCNTFGLTSALDFKTSWKNSIA